MKSFILFPFALALAASCTSGHSSKSQTTTGAQASTPKKEITQAHAKIQSPKMKKLDATLQAMETEKGIKIIANVKGLKPNSVHGFHIHENGKCEGPDFKSAGGHFNPGNESHSGPAAESKHFGDLGNLVANEKGEAKTEVLVAHGQVKELEKVIGKSVIIHAKADDLVSQPSGNSGDRIACGLIEKGTM